MFLRLDIKIHQLMILLKLVLSYLVLMMILMALIRRALVTFNPRPETGGAAALPLAF